MYKIGIPIYCLTECIGISMAVFLSQESPHPMHSYLRVSESAHQKWILGFDLKSSFYYVVREQINLAHPLYKKWKNFNFYLWKIIKNDKNLAKNAEKSSLTCFNPLFKGHSKTRLLKIRLLNIRSITRHFAVLFRKYVVYCQVSMQQ